MKSKILNRLFKLTLLVLMSTMVIVACKDDDDEDPIPPVVVLDGYYIQGAGTALTALDAKGLMKVARNEVTQQDRAELFEIYMTVKAGTDGFNIVMVSGSSQKTYGPGADFAEVVPANLDVEEPKAGLWRGSLAETTTKFTVPADGLYHIAFDKEALIVVMAKVEWGVIGGATPGGWSSSTALPSSAFDLNTMKFEIPEITMLENEWKFRYSDGWKIILDPDFDNGTTTAGLKVNCNFGGAVNALVAGGGNIANATYAIYKIYNELESCQRP